VLPGKEIEFQDALRTFVKRSLEEDSTCGAMMVLPPDGKSNEYGVLRSFPDETARLVFYRSKLFQDWERQIESLIDGLPASKELHGMEAFFYSGQTAAKAPPHKWKMAMLTWIGVWPSVYFWSSLLQPVIAPLPHIVKSGVVTALVVRGESCLD
jgi:uncharacterized protein